MTGTKFNYNSGFGINDDDFQSYNENDMKMCMNLSKDIYDKELVRNKSSNYKENVPNEIFKDLPKFHLSTKNFQVYNLIDSDKDNVSFAIASRKNEDGSIDMIVVIRGTNKDEWAGNTEITGTEYDSDKLVHDNFNKAKDSIKSAIDIYYNDLLNTSLTSNINLIITGHSRGASVANLYAKEATDAMSTTEDMGIQRFNKVTAYTFACPNVEKYNSSMESYTNIFNFCFKEDLVPTVPLTSPTDGWNYWKYGQTYLCNLEDYNSTVSYDTVKNLHNKLSPWSSVELYYNKPIFATTRVTTLYNIAHDSLGMIQSYSTNYNRFISTGLFLSRMSIYPKMIPVLYTGIKGIKNIATAHDYATYHSIINGVSTSGDITFYPCTYQSYLIMEQNESNNSSSTLQLFTFNTTNNSEPIYNINEKTKLSLFASVGNNLSLLGWDLDDPSTWTGIIWDSNGNVTDIDLSNKELTGTIDLSNFNSLCTLNLSGNEITSINLSGCTALGDLDISSNMITSLDLSSCTLLSILDCSYNDLSSNGLNVIFNTALTSLTIDDCNLSSIDVSTLVNLETLSCAFNKLTTLNIDNNTNLTSLTCSYNYLDIEKDTTFYNKLIDLQFDDCYVSYYPQSVPANAIFDATELNALKSFANAETNSDFIDWLDEDGNILR